MPIPKYAKRRDKVEGELVELLRANGASVLLIDVPVDALVGFRGNTHLVEFKSGTTGYGKALNKNQAKFQETWKGEPIIIMRSEADVNEFIKRK